MLKHYIKSGVRNLFRRKFFSSLNIVGLSIGVATFLVLMNYVDYEFSYDNYLPERERVYRVDYFEFQSGKSVLKNARTHTGLSTWIKEKLPAAAHVAKAYNENCLLFNDKAKGHHKGVWADSSFLHVFAVRMLEGDRDNALVAPFSMAISKSLAAVYFGNVSPIGRKIFFNEHVPFTVTAVFEDIPDNAAVRFNFLISWTTLLYMLPGMKPSGDFDVPWAYTYVKLNPEVGDISIVNTQLAKIANDNIPGLKKRNLTGSYKLRPLKEIHFTEGMAGEQEPGRSKMLLYCLVSVAAFILIAAWMNYVNLSMAQSFQRAEEIMVRKVYGANVKNIVNQFIVEALLMSILTLIVGTACYFLFVNYLSGYLSADFSKTQGYSERWLGYFAFIILVTVLVSVFPARLIARYKPAFILKRAFTNGSNKNLLRNGLVVFQLLISIFTIGCTLIAKNQINYMRSFDVGFNTSQTISLMGPASRNIDSLRYERFTAFRNEMLSSNQFAAGTASMNIPGEELRYHDESIRLAGSANDLKQTFWISNIDDGYLATFGLKLIAGRNIEEGDRGNSCLVNKAAVKALGFADPAKAINAEFLSGDNTRRRIVGVIEDFHHESLKRPVEPVLFFFEHPYEFGYYSFRVDGGTREGVITHMEKVWKEHYPDDPFVFYFMDSFFARQYEGDVLFGKLLSLFSVMSILVASLGLLGLTSLSVARRTKEIGIRKVVGASTFRIVMMISREYIGLVLIAFLVVLPIFYFSVTAWLNIFSYRIEIEGWMLILPGIIVFLIAWLVVGLQSLQAALADPVRSLRSE